MAFAIGFSLALAVVAFARLTGLDRERAFYSAIVIVVAHYYVLFAVMAGDMTALVMETIGLTAFAAAAVLGFRVGQWVLMIGLAAHGVFDAVHGLIITNPGVPEYWPAFCAAFDLTAPACVALLAMRRTRARAQGNLDHLAISAR